jgi:hypothetical protein
MQRRARSGAGSINSERLRCLYLSRVIVPIARPPLPRPPEQSEAFERDAMKAFTRDGCQDKTWLLPADWQGVTSIGITPVPGTDDAPTTTTPVQDGKLTLSVARGQTLRLTPA